MDLKELVVELDFPSCADQLLVIWGRLMDYAAIAVKILRFTVNVEKNILEIIKQDFIENVLMIVEIIYRSIGKQVYKEMGFLNGRS